jgi:hypothetical protein
MPYTFNGCGTRFYGNRDKGEDGSYVCTEWITFVYIPLIPIRSFRVLPTNEGTNLIVWRTQSYRTMRVPLSWPQVRNVYLFIAPILALIIFFNWSDITGWVKNDLLRGRAQPTKVEAAPIEQSLDDSSSAKACGSVLKLKSKDIDKLKLHERLSELVKTSGFTEEDFKNVSKPEELEKVAFSAYTGGYLTWDKPADPIRSDLSKKLITRINTGAEEFSANDAVIFREYANKSVQMVMKAYDMGRHDARTSPCSF